MSLRVFIATRLPLRFLPIWTAGLSPSFLPPLPFSLPYNAACLTPPRFTLLSLLPSFPPLSCLSPSIMSDQEPSVPALPESVQLSDSAALNYAFLVHSQKTLTQNLPPRVDNKLLARQKRRRTRYIDASRLCPTRLSSANSVVVQSRRPRYSRGRVPTQSQAGQGCPCRNCQPRFLG